jgi:hypothetical protein
MRAGLTTLWTAPPGGGVFKSLGHEGHVSPPRYSWVVPGGCDQLSAVFGRARYRTDALNAGRTLVAQRGGQVVWAGILDEPAPTDAGWNLTAHGAGAIGVDYRAIYSGAWGTGIFNDAVDQAIGRGLPWVRGTDIGALSGLWTGQQVDSGGQNIVDLLTLATTKGGLTWQVATGPGGVSTLTVVPLPTTPNRLLVAPGPAGVSIAAAPSVLYLRYQATADSATGSTPATFALTSVTSAAQLAAQGRVEDFTDLGSAGLIGSGGAQAVGTQVFKRFTRAAFTDAFPARHGTLLNLGGVPADPGVFYSDGQAAMVCQLLLSDFGQPGEVTPGAAPRFLVGAAEWDDAALTLTLTPFEQLRHRWSDLLSAASTPQDHPRSRPASRQRRRH